MEAVLVHLGAGRHKHMKEALECQQSFGGQIKSRLGVLLRYIHTYIHSYYIYYSLPVLTISYQLYSISPEQVYHKIEKSMAWIWLTLCTMEKM